MKGLNSMRRTAPGLAALLICLLVTAEAGAVDLTGLKGLGGSVGTSLMIGDWQYRTDVRPWFTGDAIFKYGLSPKWVFTGMFGFGWNGYSNEESWLSDTDLLVEVGYPPEPQQKVTTISPFVAGFEYRFGTGTNVPYLGAGAGIYMTQVLFNRTVAHDPRNGARHRKIDLGFYGRVGLEQFLSDVVAIDYDALIHVVFSEDREKFPDPTSADLERFGRDFRAYNGDMQNIQIRIGLRYYWGGGL
jgi:hypothetical protein